MLAGKVRATAIGPDGLLAAAILARIWLAGRSPHVPSMTTDDRVSELLAKAKQAKAMTGFACSPERKRTLANVAADYEQLARCRLVYLDTQQHLAQSRRLLRDLSQMCDGTVRPAVGPEEDPSANG
jgi:hypothetical protein